MTTSAITRTSETNEVERTRSGPTYVPAVDIIETPEELRLLIDVPGATQDGVEIEFERGVLSIYARVADRAPGDAGQYLLREYGVGDFARTFRVSEVVDSNNISATLEHGVLTVTLPKAAEARPRKISVRGA